jgi:mRNA interferase MazF
VERYGDMRNYEGYCDPTAGAVLRKTERRNDMEIRRGDIYWVEIKNAVGSEMDKDRPGIVVTCDELNESSPVVGVVYLSTSNRRELPEHVTIRSVEKPSTALCEQIYTVSKERLGKLCGRCTPEEMRRIDTALMIGLALSPTALQAPVSGDNGHAEESMRAKLAESEREIVTLQARLDTMFQVYGRTLEELASRRAAG